MGWIKFIARAIIAGVASGVLFIGAAGHSWAADFSSCPQKYFIMAYTTHPAEPEYFSTTEALDSISKTGKSYGNLHFPTLINTNWRSWNAEQWSLVLNFYKNRPIDTRDADRYDNNPAMRETAERWRRDIKRENSERIAAFSCYADAAARSSSSSPAASASSSTSGNSDEVRQLSELSSTLTADQAYSFNKCVKNSKDTKDNCYNAAKRGALDDNGDAKKGSGSTPGGSSKDKTYANLSKCLKWVPHLASDGTRVGAFMENKCAQKINFTFCYDGDENLSCEKFDYGSDTVDGGKKVTITGTHSTRENARYRVFGCEYPGVPTNVWLKGKTISATCK